MHAPRCCPSRRSSRDLRFGLMPDCGSSRDLLYLHPRVVSQCAKHLIRTRHDLIVLRQAFDNLNIRGAGDARFDRPKEGHTIVYDEYTFFLDLFLIGACGGTGHRNCTCGLRDRIRRVEFSNRQRLNRRRHDLLTSGGLNSRGARKNGPPLGRGIIQREDRKSTRLNSSHGYISYALLFLKKKKKEEECERLSVGAHN